MTSTLGEVTSHRRWTFQRPTLSETCFWGAAGTISCPSLSGQRSVGCSSGMQERGGTYGTVMAPAASRRGTASLHDWGSQSYQSYDPVLSMHDIEQPHSSWACLDRRLGGHQEATPRERRPGEAVRGAPEPVRGAGL